MVTEFGCVVANKMTGKAVYEAPVRWSQRRFKKGIREKVWWCPDTSV
jgi:hypothetical protein